MKGKLLLKQGLQHEACTTLEKGLELDPDHRQIIFELAYAADLYGNDEQAIELYEKLSSSSPLNVSALINLADNYEDRGKYSDAEVCMSKVLEHYPNHKRASLFLKDVQSSQNMYYDENVERNREKRDAVLDIPISDFELSVRSRNCLKKMDIHSLGDLLRTSEAELLSYKNFGETSLNEIKAMLRQKGLQLGQILDEDQSPTSSPAAQGPLPSAADPSLLSKPVSELELSVRARKCLQRLGISLLGDLASKTEGELLSSKNFGQTSLTEIKLRLAENGLSLRKLDSRKI